MFIIWSLCNILLEGGRGKREASESGRKRERERERERERKKEREREMVHLLRVQSFLFQVPL